MTSLNEHCLCCRLLRRLTTLLSQQASLMASNEAFKKQAEGASVAAKKYIEDNELLQEVTHKYIVLVSLCLKVTNTTQCLTSQHCY